MFVYADWQDIQAPMLMGILFVMFVRGKEVFSSEELKNT